jgi:hypothetical protein
MDTRQKRRIIMYHEFHSLRNVEHFTIRRIADHLSINFRTVKKLFSMPEEQFGEYAVSRFREFLII